MYRTTTTAALLVTVAVSALAGCVTVQHPPASRPPTAPVAPPPTSVPRPDGEADPQVVQAPAREALELVGPSPRAEPRPPARQAPAPRTPAHDRSQPPHPEPRRHQQPRVETPDVSEPVRKNTDVCALGKQYGGWPADSPEAVICEQTYSR